jgi:FKBP-type peptidyl-prolyl cis-trans isomerase
MDGRVFDQSESFRFKLATSEWAARWDYILPRLKEGEKVRMIFPHTLAYGPVGEYTNGGKVRIPPYETLLFDVEILSVEAVIEEDPAGPE